MKKCFISILLFAVILVSPLNYVSAAGLNLSAKAAVLMVADTGEVLYSVNKDKRLSMASTTKIMTSLLALEALTPELEITVTQEMVSVEGTSMGLLPGDKVTLRSLVYGMLLQSGNDAANTVACVLGGDGGFAELMNERAAEIGMKNSNFVTASGLDSKEHYSSAYDMALLAREAIKNPEFRSICSQKYAKLSYGNPPYMRTLTNHNRLLWSYPGAIGMKTGFTKKSGRCLVGVAERDGVTLIAVTLSAPDDWQDHKRMFDYGFNSARVELLDADLSGISLKVAGGEKSEAELCFAEPPGAVFTREGVGAVTREVRMRPFEYAPVKKGDVAGYAYYYADGELICESAIVAAQDVEVKAPEKPPQKEEPQEVQGFFTKLFNKIKEFVSK